MDWQFTDWPHALLIGGLFSLWGLVYQLMKMVEKLEKKINYLIDQMPPRDH